MRLRIDPFIKKLWIDGRWNAERIIALKVYPEAVAFYDEMLARACAPEALISAMPDHRLVYIMVPKVASTFIRDTLAKIAGRRSLSLAGHHRKFAGPRGPRRIGICRFHRLVTDPETLRFAFVRNPYDRLVSCWADKFREKPLIPGDPFVEKYLVTKDRIGTAMPAGADRTLSFADFVTYATSTIDARVNPHWQLQSVILGVPGLSLNFIGKFESLVQDLEHVLDHVRAGEKIRATAIVPLNVSSRTDCAEYYTPELARRVYSTYERDFDQFGYSRTLQP